MQAPDVATVMKGEELRRVFQLSPRAFYRYQAAGQFERFELRPRLMHARLYSRKLVQEYLDGAPSSRTWGQQPLRRPA